MLRDLFDLLISLQHFHFMRPLWLLLVIPMFFILRAIHKRDDSLSAWRHVMSAEMLDNLTISGNQSKLISPGKVSWSLCLLLVIVIAGPSWTQQPSPFTQDKSALVIALDVSDTMEQSDVQPSRLIRAKQKILELLEKRGDSNTALIAYAGSAHIVMPVTNDREMISHFLDVLDSKIIPLQGKIPQNIIPLAESLLKPTGVPGSVLMIGDGASEESQSAFSSYFNDGEHQLIIWAFGDVSKVTNQEVGSSLIPLQLEQLDMLASKSNGRLVLMTHDKQDVERVEQYLNNNLVILDDEATPWYDAGYPIVFVIAGLFLLWFRKGWTLQW